MQKVRRGRAALVPDHVGDHAGDTRTKSGAVRYEPFASHDAIIRHPVTEDLLRWVDREEITVLLVTHDLEEAITLSDRVHLLTQGPYARIHEVYEVPLDRPRDLVGTRTEPSFGPLLRRMWDDLAAVSSERQDGRHVQAGCR